MDSRFRSEWHLPLCHSALDAESRKYFFFKQIKNDSGSPIKLGMTSYYGSSIKDFEDDSKFAFEDVSGCDFKDDSGCIYEDDSGFTFEDDSYFEFLQTQEWRKET